MLFLGTKYKIFLKLRGRKLRHREVEHLPTVTGSDRLDMK